MKKIFFVLSIILPFFISGCAKGEKPLEPRNEETTAQQEGQDVEQKVQSFTISGTSEDEKSRWRVEGESADIFSDVVNMRTIKVNSYGKEVSMVLTADEGTFFKNSKDVELRKNVIANTDEGTTLKTDKLKWDAATEKVVSDVYVYVEREDINVSGTGAEAIPGMKKVWLNRDVKMTLKPHAKDSGAGINLLQSEESLPAKTKSPTIITCDGPLKADYQNYILYFNKNVVIKDKEGTIYADKVVVYINPKERKIYKAVARGNVRIVRQRNTSYSDEAVYLPNKRKAILSGRPKVVIYSVDKLLKEDEPNKSL